MATRLLTADQVKDYLNITDFRHLTRNKLIEFVSAIPDMDKEVAIKTIEQFPEFCGYAKVLLEHYKASFDSMLNENSSCTQAVMGGYAQILNVLSDLIKNENITSDDKRFFAEKMVEVTDKMAVFDTNNKSFLTDITKYVSWFAGGALIVCTAVLGVKAKGTQIPQVV